MLAIICKETSTEKEQTWMIEYVFSVIAKIHVKEKQMELNYGLITKMSLFVIDVILKNIVKK